MMSHKIPTNGPGSQRLTTPVAFLFLSATVALGTACGGKHRSMESLAGSDAQGSVTSSTLKSAAESQGAKASQNQQAADSSSSTPAAPSSVQANSLGLLEFGLESTHKLGKTLSHFSRTVRIIGRTSDSDTFSIHLDNGDRFSVNTSQSPLNASYVEMDARHQNLGANNTVIDMGSGGAWKINASSAALMSPSGEQTFVFEDDDASAGQEQKLLSLSSNQLIIRAGSSIYSFSVQSGSRLISKISLPEELQKEVLVAAGYFVDSPKTLWLLTDSKIFVHKKDKENETWTSHKVNWGTVSGNPPVSITAELENPLQPKIKGSYFAFSHSSIYYIRSDANDSK